MGLTHDLGQFVSGLRYDDIPDAGINVARLGLIDCSSVMIAGEVENVTRIVEQTVTAGVVADESSVCFTTRRTGALPAAIINGTAAHALDYDDAGGHRSAVLIPALLAEGEAIGASGRALLTAYVAGFEVWSELVRREDGQLHEKGWHPTGIYGAVAAAAAMSCLHGLDPERTAAALALGASQSSGIVANFGTMTKPFHAGAAAQAGILAARLAASGMTASAQALEHPRGFLSAVSQYGRFDAERSTTHLGRDWHIVRDGVSIKKFPTCYCTHRTIDALLALLKERPVNPAEVAEIVVHIGRTQAAILINSRPQTGLEAKFSIEFAVACGLLERAVTLRHLTDEFVQRPEVQSLFPKVRTVLIDEYDPTLTSYSPYDQVEIVLASGERLASEKVVRARGHISRPLERDELKAKFASCLEVADSDLDPDCLFELLENIESQPAGWMHTLPRHAKRKPRPAV